MSPSNLQILAYETTPLGDLCLRRRELLSRPGTVITEITLDHQLLMSSHRGVDEFSAYGGRGSVMYESAPFAAWWRVSRPRFNDSFADAFEADRPQLR